MSDLRNRCIEAGAAAAPSPGLTRIETATLIVNAVLPLVLAEQPQYEQVGWRNAVNVFVPWKEGKEQHNRYYGAGMGWEPVFREVKRGR